MSPFQKAFCRAFQFSFRAAIPPLPYRKPRLIDAKELEQFYYMVVIEDNEH